MRKRLLSTSEQVAVFLRDEISRGRWSGTLPGIHRLATDLGFPRKPVERALLQLENEGLLVPQGVGRRRRIVPAHKPGSRAMRVAILNYDPPSVQEISVVDLMNRLSDQGHTAFFADQTLVELDMDVRRVARLVRKTGADIWIVTSGPSEVLGWFVAQGIPAFSVFGNFPDLPMAGMGLRYLPSMLAATRRLIEFGHRRVVFLACRGRHEDPTGRLWRRLLDEMELHGIATGSYNLPKWEDSRDGFHDLLGSLFEHTPPTALIIEESPHLVATLQFCSQRGLKVPQDVSLVCMQHGSDFDYCHPSMAHIHWDYRPMVRRVVQWTNHMALGKQDLRQSYTKAVFVEGGTIDQCGKPI